MYSQTVMETALRVLAILYATIFVCKCEEVAFYRCNNLTKILQYVYYNDADTPVYDIYAQTRISTCSLRAGVFTGQGISSDPYSLRINLQQGLLAQSPDCGVTQSADGTVHLNMAVQMSCSGLSSSDLRSYSSCKMLIPASKLVQTHGKAFYSCKPPSTIVFQFSRPPSDKVAPSDIYAVGRRSTCSKSVGAGSGQGLELDPFMISMNTSNTTQDCGIQNVGNGVYNVTMYVQQFQSVITVSDISYLLTCNFTAATTLTLDTVVYSGISNPPTNTITPTAPAASLSVVSEAGAGAMTSLVVGQKIRLVAQLLEDGIASGLRVISCEARPGPNLQPVIQVLGSDGCSTGPALVPPFIGQSPVGKVAMTSLFNVFKFDQSNTVYFKCQALFCYDNNLTCLGNHCEFKVRRRRDTILRNNDTLQVVIHVIDVVHNSNLTDQTGNIQEGATSADSAHNTDQVSLLSPLTWPISAVVVVCCLSAMTVLSYVVTVCTCYKHLHNFHKETTK